MAEPPKPPPELEPSELPPAVAPSPEPPELPPAAAPSPEPPEPPPVAPPPAVPPAPGPAPSDPPFGGAESVDLEDPFPFKQPPDFSGRNEPLTIIPEIDRAGGPAGMPPRHELSAESQEAPSASSPPPPLDPPPPRATPYGRVTSANTRPPEVSREHALTWGEPATEADRNLALLAHMSNLLNVLFPIPIVLPLAIYLFYKDKSAFVAYHALQATVMNAVIWVLGFITCGLFIFVGWVLSIVWGIKAYRGDWEGYPLIGSIGR